MIKKVVPLAAIAFFLVLLMNIDLPPAKVPATTVQSPAASPELSVLVDIKQIAPSVHLDMRYATSNNFMGKQLYSVARCLLRPPVAQAIAQVQAQLEKEGLGLMLWDCYRPLSIQKEMWKIVPDPAYVADPARGSRHNRGAAVDLTLVGRDGKPLEMPTEFDDFSEKAHPGYAGASATAQSNSLKLAQVMTQQGFASVPTEWWHFNGPDSDSFDVLDIPLN